MIPFSLREKARMRGYKSRERYIDPLSPTLPLRGRELVQGVRVLEPLTFKYSDPLIRSLTVIVILMMRWIPSL